MTDKQTPRDISRLVLAFWFVTGMQLLFSKLVGRSLDDWDHTHALIMAGVYVIVKAVRSERVSITIIGNEKPDNWESGYGK